MAKFVYIYTGGGMPETPEEGEKVMAAWMSAICSSRCWRAGS